MMIALATALVVIFAAVLAVLGDIPRPTEGYNLRADGIDIIMPLSIVLCRSL